MTFGNEYKKVLTAQCSEENAETLSKHALSCFVQLDFISPVTPGWACIPRIRNCGDNCTYTEYYSCCPVIGVKAMKKSKQWEANTSISNQVTNIYKSPQEFKYEWTTGDMLVTRSDLKLTRTTVKVLGINPSLELQYWTSKNHSVWTCKLAEVDYLRNIKIKEFCKI